MLWGSTAMGVRRVFALVVGLPAESGLMRILAAEQEDQEQERVSDPRELRRFFPTEPPKGR